MPTLSGGMDVLGREPPEPCRWCGEPTLTRLAPMGSVQGPIPLHALCGAEVIVAYRDLRAGVLAPELADRLRQLGAGE